MNEYTNEVPALPGLAEDTHLIPQDSALSGTGKLPQVHSQQSPPSAVFQQHVQYLALATGQTRRPN